MIKDDRSSVLNDLKHDPFYTRLASLFAKELSMY